MPPYYNGTYNLTNNSVRSPFYNSSFSDLYYIQGISYSQVYEGIGQNIVTNITADGMYYSQIMLMDSQINSDRYPAYLKYKYTYGTNTEYYESHYVYLCD